MSSDDSTCRTAWQDVIDEQELKRRYHGRLSDWSEPGVVKIYRGGQLPEPLIEPDWPELQKRIFKLLWNRARP
jgi:hypothetical protein